MIDRSEKRKRQLAVELQNSRVYEKRSNTGLSVARRSSLPSSGSPQRWSKSASPQLPSGKDNRDVKRRYSYPARGSQWGGGFYGYRLKFWLFYGYRLIFFSYG